MTEQESKERLKKYEEARLKAEEDWNALSQEERERLEKESENCRFWEDLSDFDGWKVTPPSK